MEVLTARRSRVGGRKPVINLMAAVRAEEVAAPLQGQTARDRYSFLNGPCLAALSPPLRACSCSHICLSGYNLSVLLSSAWQDRSCSMLQ